MNSEMLVLNKNMKKKESYTIFFTTDHVIVMVAIVTCGEDAGLLAHFLLFLLCHLPTDKEADDNDDDDEECHHAHGDANDGTRAYAAPRRVCDLVGHRLT